MIKNLILYILCLQIIIAPLLYGSVDTYAWGSLFVLICIAFMMYLYEKAKDNTQSLMPSHISLLLVFFLMSISIQFFLPEKTLPIPSLKAVENIEVLSITSNFNHSYSLIDIKKSFYQWLLIIMSFVLVVYVTKSRKEIKILFGCIAFIASFEGIVSFLQYFFSATNPIQFYATNYRGAFSGVTGTFIERNTCACFLTMSIPIIIAQMIFLFQKRKGKHKKQSVKNKSTEESIRYTLLSLLLFSAICASLAIFFTLSRAGLITFFGSIILFSLIYLKKKNAKYFILMTGTIIALILIFMVVAYFFIGVDNRFENVKEDFSYRFIIYKTTLQIISDHFWFGCGGGNFLYVMEMYRKPPITLEYRYCENDYIQFVAEYGIFSSLIALVFLFYITKIILGKEKSKTRFSYGLWCGCIVAIIAIMIFALFHFPFQIPSLKLYTAYIIAIALSMKVKSYSLSLNSVNKSRK